MSSSVKLSVVIPTLGRPTLERTLESCAGFDEIVVVLDTARGGSLPCDLPDNTIYWEGDYGVTGGHAGRVAGMALATGTHIATMDDDDVYTTGAVEVIRAAADTVPVIFRMDDPLHGIIWREPVIRWANVSTQMIVVPNQPHLFGSWTPHRPGWQCPGGDYTFTKETVENFGGVLWCDEIICTIRPDIARAA